MEELLEESAPQETTEKQEVPRFFTHEDDVHSNNSEENPKEKQ